MKQYSDNDAPRPAAKMAANHSDPDNKRLDKRVRELSDQVKQQQVVIDRMHRDIVRLREAINGVAARIK
jgi:hypothetical protein